MKKTLVIGARGFIGKHFVDLYRRFYPDLITTDRSLLDLANPSIDHLPLEEYTDALIAAAIPRLMACEQSPEYTFRCNVEGTLQLAGALAQKGIKPILFSTDYVFDGVEGEYSEESALNPLNEYGRQKARLEEKIRDACGDNYLLIRPGKVFGLKKGDKTLLDEMASSLNGGSTVRAAYDQVFCPIFINDLLQSIVTLQNLNCTGVFNICGLERWSRYDLALEVARALSVPSNLVHQISLEDLKEPFLRPKCTTMRTDKLRRIIDEQFMSLKDSIQKIATYYQDEEES